AASDPSAFPKPGSQSLGGDRAGSRFLPLTLGDVPAHLRPKDPNNLYALCMDSEMPPDAMMIKVAWARHADSHPPFNTGMKMADGLRQAPGYWVEGPTGGG